MAELRDLLAEKLKELLVVGCDLHSLPKKVGALSQLQTLSVSRNTDLGAAPDDIALPKESRG
jgi:Leucine-rich repeat (LRR) protein